MSDLVTREHARLIGVHLLDGVTTKRAQIGRPFVYRFAFTDLGTHADFAIDGSNLETTEVDRPDAVVRLPATMLARLFIILRGAPVDPEDLAGAGFELEGDRDLHRTVFELVKCAPSHFQRALDAIDATRKNATENGVLLVQHESDEATERAALAALAASRPLLVRGYPFPWAHTTREDFLATYGDLDIWAGGIFLPLKVFCEGTHEAPPEALSPVNPTDAVYATNLVAPDALVSTFGPPFFRDCCGPPRIFGGRSVLPDPEAWSRVTRPHRHPHDVIAWQVFGRKKWLLVPPAHGAPLELRALGFDTQFCGVLDPDVVDDPALQAAASSVVMEPGELLVLPGGWFHVTYVRREPALGFSSFAKDELLRFAPSRQPS